MVVHLSFAAVTLGAAFVAHRLTRAWLSSTEARVLAWGTFAIALAGSAAGMAAGSRALPVAVLPLSVATICLIHVVSAMRSRTLRRSDAALPLRGRYALQGPRVYFGGVIVAGAIAGLLPWEFALPIGLGDIAVGILAWGLGRVPAGHPWARRLAAGFALLGIADLVNALRLGVQVAVPALIASDTPPMLLMLPFFVVPVLLAQHLLMVRRAASPEALS